jgi:hypothetical protein
MSRNKAKKKKQMHFGVLIDLSRGLQIQIQILFILGGSK